MGIPHPLQTWLDQTSTSQHQLAKEADTHQARISQFLTGTSGLSGQMAMELIEAARRIAARKGIKAVDLTLKDLVVDRPRRASDAPAESKSKPKAKSPKRTTARAPGGSR